MSEKGEYEDIRELAERALAPAVQEQRQLPVPIKPRLDAGIRGASHSPSPMSTATRTALVQVYNEMHGLIVGVGKNYCRKSTLKCDECPLHPFLPSAK